MYISGKFVKLTCCLSSLLFVWDARPITACKLYQKDHPEPNKGKLSN